MNSSYIRSVKWAPAAASCLVFLIVAASPVMAQSKKKPADLGPWLKMVETLPVEQQAQAVATKLKELNPGFRGEFKSKVEGGVVTELGVSSAYVSDLSPLKALKNLQKLNLKDPEHRQGQVSDLSPLQGMKLRFLDLYRNPGVTDLKPLAGMPLEELNCNNCKGVRDLAPLNGAPLRVLDLCWCDVRSIKPLQKAPLVSLLMDFTKVDDLKPLEGKKLEIFSFQQCPSRSLAPLFKMRLKTLMISPTPGATLPIADLAFAADMPLESLTLWTIPSVAQLDPLRQKPLVHLNLATSKVADLTPLTGMKLRTFVCTRCDIKDLRPLAEMPLVNFDVSSTLVSSLEPLRGMELGLVGCSSTRVSDLAPLKGMPVQTLRIDNTSVKDLTPIEGMALKSLWIENTPIKDLAPLVGMPLTELRFDSGLLKNPKNREIIQGLSRLETINGKPKSEILN